MGKKVLLISNSFYPEISPRSFRTTELAKEFSRQGHDVTVITDGHPKQAELVNQFRIKIIELGKREWKGIPVSPNRYLNLISRVISKLAAWLFEYPSLELVFLVKKAIKNEANYDILISIAVPHTIHWGVASEHKKSWNLTKTWIADCGDPYMGQQNDTLKPPFYFGWVEKWFCKKVDFITVPTNNSINGYFSEFHSKIRVIPQGFRFEDSPLFNGEKEKKFPVFAYSGSFIKGKRDPKEFLVFLNTLDINYEFHIYTHKTHLHYVEPYIKGNNRVKLFTYIERNQLLFELSKMDFVVNFENVGKNQTPSKLIDYAIINKPILPIVTGNLNPELIYEFLNGNYKNKLQIENPDQYRIENVVSAFLSLIKTNV